MASSWSWVTKRKVMRARVAELSIRLHLLAQVGVERRERLVEQEQQGTIDERARKGHALLLAATQLDGRDSANSSIFTTRRASSTRPLISVAEVFLTRNAVNTVSALAYSASQCEMVLMACASRKLPQRKLADALRKPCAW